MPEASYNAYGDVILRHVVRAVKLESLLVQSQVAMTQVGRYMVVDSAEYLNVSCPDEDPTTDESRGSLCQARTLTEVRLLPIRMQKSRRRRLTGSRRKIHAASFSDTAPPPNIVPGRHDSWLFVPLLHATGAVLTDAAQQERSSARVRGA